MTEWLARWSGRLTSTEKNDRESFSRLFGFPLRLAQAATKGTAMGTNFYALPPVCPNPCLHCRQGQLHICKSFTTWRGYSSTDVDIVELGLAVSVELRSVRQWLDFLGQDGMRIIDENERHWPFREFRYRALQLAERDRGRQYRWVQENRDYIGVDLKNYWLDDEGFTFYDGYFS